MLSPAEAVVVLPELLVRPVVNSYQPHPEFVPGQHFDFAGAQPGNEHD